MRLMIKDNLQEQMLHGSLQFSSLGSIEMINVGKNARSRALLAQTRSKAKEPSYRIRQSPFYKLNDRTMSAQNASASVFHVLGYVNRQHSLLPFGPPAGLALGIGRSGFGPRV